MDLTDAESEKTRLPYKWETNHDGHQKSCWLETKKTSLQLVARTGSDRFRVGENTPAVPVGDKPRWRLRRRARGCHELDVAALLLLRGGEHDELHDTISVGTARLKAPCVSESVERRPPKKLLRDATMVLVTKTRTLESVHCCIESQ